jgi:hypothetical protein
MEAIKLAEAKDKGDQAKSGKAEWICCRLVREIDQHLVVIRFCGSL